MNFNDITIGIVTFNSEKVIYDCLNSIKKIKTIIIFDNSNDYNLKRKIKKKYPNIKFLLSKNNLGYGAGNNRIIDLCRTKYLFILNPDTILDKNCENELLKSVNYLNKKTSIIAPVSNDKNYGFFYNKKKINNIHLEVDYVKGFAMLINIKIVKKIGKFNENFFLYLEEIDLCKRLKNKNFSIFINNKAKIKHLAAKSSNIGFEFEKCRNWHWMWSNFYYYKKHNFYLFSLIKFSPKILLLGVKIIFNLIFFKKLKMKIAFYRLSGLLNSVFNKSSWYRPKIIKFY